MPKFPNEEPRPNESDSEIPESIDPEAEETPSAQAQRSEKENLTDHQQEEGIKPNDIEFTSDVGEIFYRVKYNNGTVGFWRKAPVLPLDATNKDVRARLLALRAKHGIKK